MENKTGKYFKYAFGEIILVVIGILIALTVAEWNNSRHENKIEIRLLKELHKGVSDDLKKINKELETTNACIANLIELDSLLKLEVPLANEHHYKLFGNVYGL
jgi:sensor domain CHASE-containing protein